MRAGHVVVPRGQSDIVQSHYRRFILRFKGQIEPNCLFDCLSEAGRGYLEMTGRATRTEFWVTHVVQLLRTLQVWPKYSTCSASPPPIPHPPSFTKLSYKVSTSRQLKRSREHYFGPHQEPTNKRSQDNVQNRSINVYVKRTYRRVICIV